MTFAQSGAPADPWIYDVPDPREVEWTPQEAAAAAHILVQCLRPDTAYGWLAQEIAKWMDRDAQGRAGIR